MNTQVLLFAMAVMFTDYRGIDAVLKHMGQHPEDARVKEKVYILYIIYIYILIYLSRRAAEAKVRPHVIRRRMDVIGRRRAAEGKVRTHLISPSVQVKRTH